MRVVITELSHRIAVAVSRARAKHPDFCPSLDRAMVILMEEIGEIAEAIQGGDSGRIREEIDDALAVLARMDRMLDQEWP